MIEHMSSTIYCFDIGKNKYKAYLLYINTTNSIYYHYHGVRA